MASDDMWMDNLKEWILDDCAIVTAKSVSRDLKVHVNVAKEMMYKFKEDHTDEVDVIYLLAGKGRVRLVREQQLSSAEKEMSPLTSKHVYAVSKKGVLDNGLALCWRQMAAVDAAPYCNALSGIANKRAVPSRDTDLVIR